MALYEERLEARAAADHAAEAAPAPIPQLAVRAIACSHDCATAAKMRLHQPELFRLRNMYVPAVFDWPRARQIPSMRSLTHW